MNADAIESTRRWIASMVIGLNLCPFARRPFDAGLIRYRLTNSASVPELLDDLARELQHLASTPRAEVETSILIHPHVLGDFLDYNDFLGDADDLVRRLGLEGEIQVASFHPDYRFADCAADAVENYTNRSPYPMLHLLREASVSEVAGDPEALGRVPERNIETLRKLGRKAVAERLRGPSEPEA